MRRVKVGIVAFMLLRASPCVAQQADDSARNAARQLGAEALELAKNGDHRGAVERFDKATALMPVPTLALLSGRSLEQLGRWVEAVERYRRAQGMSVDADLPQAFRESQLAAQSDAATAAEALGPRIPSVVLEIAGAESSTVEVKLDGKTLHRAMLGVRIPLDPGAHSIVARRGTDVVRESVALEERTSKKVVLRFHATSGSPVAGAPTMPAEADARSDRRTAWATAGWIALGVGGAGLAVGTVFYLSGRGMANDLERECKDHVCPTKKRADVDSYDATKTASTVGFVIGSLGVAAGTTILLVAPRSTRQGRGSVRAFVGLGSAGVSGEF